tara:strand:- start:871 stop:975 length:105 start_codon:yes stop_codon:yes gene_type:complete
MKMDKKTRFANGFILFGMTINVAVIVLILVFYVF